MANDYYNPPVSRVAKAEYYTSNGPVGPEGIASNKAILVPPSEPAPPEAPMRPFPSPAREELFNSLQQDVASSSKALGESAQRMGAGGTEIKGGFTERGLKIGNRVIAKNNLDRLMSAQKQAIGRYVKSAAFGDQLSQQIATEELTEKFNKMRMEAYEQAMKMDLWLQKNRASRETSQKTAELMGGIMGKVITGAMMA